ncbi:MAG TPA: VCBS repeat-containing protein [Nannocystaceae bacterium]|nr:VCBS repeat-containing protein [Nannocystaceae bacterium]
MLIAACGGSGSGDDTASGEGSLTLGTDGTLTMTSDASTSGASSTATSTADSTSATTADSGGPIFDVGGVDTGGTAGDDGPKDVCHVLDDMDAVGDCEMEAPADSFEPEIQWTWTGPGGEVSIVPALVANLTDDDGNGEIDLCDTPDVVVVAGGISYTPANIWVLDGATGAEHFRIQVNLDPSVTPALGDIDGDGLVEIVSATPGGILGGIPQPSYLVAFEHDGTMKWQSDAPIDHGQGFAIALADLDADGNVEIIADDTVTDANGELMWAAPMQVGWSMYDVWHCTATAVADLDDDGEQEVILGKTAWRADGTMYYDAPSLEPGFPQVANLDDDAQPEVLVTTRAGASILEHDGSVTVLNATPSGDGYPAWFRPASIHDLDGDNVSELALSAASHYSVVERDMTVIWTAPVQDGSGWSAGTAFDFLGDGIAEAMYTDEINLYVFDGGGTPLLTIPRSSPTLIEYPTVADVDNDGSAEILVVSFGVGNPALQVIRDVDDRWIQARRIWNQHTYHVTNVREDGTIPQHEPASWSLLNTYRTNAQIEGGGLCKPDPRG